MKLSKDSPLISLSKRERQVLYLLTHGQSNRDIAKELGIALSTTNLHVRAILRKLDVTSRINAAIIAAEVNYHKDCQL